MAVISRCGVGLAALALSALALVGGARGQTGGGGNSQNTLTVMDDSASTAVVGQPYTFDVFALPPNDQQQQECTATNVKWHWDVTADGGGQVSEDTQDSSTDPTSGITVTWPTAGVYVVHVKCTLTYTSSCDGNVTETGSDDVSVEVDDAGPGGGGDTGGGVTAGGDTAGGDTAGGTGGGTTSGDTTAGGTNGGGTTTEGTTSGGTTGGIGKTWDPGDPIDPGTLTAPAEAAPGTTVTVSVAGASDTDHWTEGGAAGSDADALVYNWTCSAGMFTGDTSGPSVDWVAPAQQGAATITCTVDDLPTAVVAPDTGTRDDRNCSRIVSTTFVSERAPCSRTGVQPGFSAPTLTTCELLRMTLPRRSARRLMWIRRPGAPARRSRAARSRRPRTRLPAARAARRCRWMSGAA